MTSPAVAAPCLIGLPYGASSSHLRGQALAPPLIRAALHSPAGNVWTETLHDLGAPNGLGDAGDLAVSSTAAAREQIRAGVADLTAAVAAKFVKEVAGRMMCEAEQPG